MTSDSGDHHIDSNNDCCGNSGISNDGDNNSCGSTSIKKNQVVVVVWNAQW